MRTNHSILLCTLLACLPSGCHDDAEVGARRAGDPATGRQGSPVREAVGTAADGPRLPGPIAGGDTTTASTFGSAGIQDPEVRRFGFKTWHEDFPYSTALSPLQPGRWYDKSRRRILETVASNLSGTCSRDAWLLAKRFFGHASEDDAEILTQTLDRALQAGAMDLAETVVGAMGSTGQTQFGPALIRALEWRRKSLQNAATSALASCGTRELIRESKSSFLDWFPSAQVHWFEAARRLLPPAEAASDLREALALGRLGPLSAEFVKIAIKLPVEHAAEALRGYWDHPPPGLEGTILGLRHASGDGAATAILREMLNDESPRTRQQALGSLRIGSEEAFLDRVLELATDSAAEVRIAVTELLFSLGDDPRITATFESLALDENVIVRQNALRRLVELGQMGMLDDLMEDLSTATGSQFRLRMADAVAARDPRAIEVLVGRMHKAGVAEKRGYLSQIAHMRRAEAFPYFGEMFLEPRVNLAGPDGPPELESDAYLALLMGNLDGAEWEALTMFGTLDSTDYRRRALMLSATISIANDREIEELSNDTYEVLRGVVFDMEEIPQMRFLALSGLIRGITIKDVQRLSRLTRKEGRPMKEAWTSFLFEHF